MGAMARSIPRKCSLLNKLGSFPIKYKGWSLKSGDTIVLNETGAPDSTTFSIITFQTAARQFSRELESHRQQCWKGVTYQGTFIFGNNAPYRDSLIWYKYSSGEIKLVAA